MALFQRLMEIQQLPTLPEIVLRIQRLIMSEEGDSTLLARIIEQDPALAAKILKVANSSFYSSAGGKVSSISRAITRIGFNEVGHIALAVNFVQQFSHKSDILDYKVFWKHALTAAYLCRNIAEAAPQGIFHARDRHALFLTGLLHDVGILIYDQFFHDKFEEIMLRAASDEISFLAAEKCTVPTEMHGVVGGELMGLWKIDAAVAAAVRFHHAPGKAPEMHRKLACVAYLAEYYLGTMTLGSFEGSIEQGSCDALTEVGVSHDTVCTLLQRAQEEVERSELVAAMEKNTTFSNLKTI
jgi:HD-like signal output (HDOD) protein